MSAQDIATRIEAAKIERESYLIELRALTLRAIACRMIGDHGLEDTYNRIARQVADTAAKLANRIDCLKSVAALPLTVDED